MGGEDSKPEVEGRLDKQLRKAARWAQRVSPGAGERLPPVAGDDEHAAHWGGVAGAFEQYALDVSGVPGAASAVGILRALYGVEDAQAAMLGRIDRNVRLLREGSFKSGRLLLQEAGRVGPEDSDYADFLKNARHHLYDAREVAASIQERALVEFYLGAVYALEGKASDAQYWLGQSHESARQVMIELGSTATNVKVLHSKRTTAALTYIYPAGLLVLPAKLKKVWGAEHASSTLEEFVPFANCVVCAFNSVATGSKLAPIELEKAADGSFSLYVGGDEKSGTGSSEG